MLEGFRRVFKALSISYPEATVVDLFQRADLNGAGMIDYSKFLNFAQNQPHLIEVIYSRRQLCDRAIRDKGVTAYQEKQDESQRTERLLRQQWNAAKGELKQNAAFELAESVIQNAKQSLRARNEELVCRQSELDFAKVERTVKERSLIDARDVERKAMKPPQDTEKRSSCVWSGTRRGSKNSRPSRRKSGSWA